MACTWVTPVALIGHAFASDVSTLRDYIEKTSWGITTGLFLLKYFIWRRYKSRMRASERRTTLHTLHQPGNH